MVQWLRALTALPDNMDKISSIHRAALCSRALTALPNNMDWIPSIHRAALCSRGSHALLTFSATRHESGTQMHMQAKPPSTLN